MAEWTPEANEYLDGYLKQVRALARGAGEDGDEIASDLREHIETKATEAAGTLITLDLLVATIAEVGTPHEVLAHGLGAVVSRGTDPGASTSSGSPGNIRSNRPGSFGLKLVKATGVLILMSISAASVVAYYEVGYSEWLNQRRDSWELRQRGRYGTPEYAESKRLREAHYVISSTQNVVDMLRLIRDAENRFILEEPNDVDADGRNDYATIHQLRDAGLLAKSDEEIERACDPYVLNLTLKRSSDSGGPSFECEAVVIPEDSQRPSIHMDASGKITEVGRPMTKIIPLNDQQAEAR